jgi:tetratricopeptide (TPR) repeat protein
MAFPKFLMPAAATLIAFPAAAAVTTVGGSFARTCFEAADVPGQASAAALAACDMALNQEAIPSQDIVATYVNRGVLRMRRGDLAGAVADFDEAIRRDPDQAEAYLNKGAALIRVPGKADAAVTLFSAAIEKKTKRPAHAFLGRGIAYEELGNLKSAWADYRSASVAAPRWDQPRLELARFKVGR